MNNHPELRSKIKAGDILLSRKHGDTISHAIQKVTGSKWSHSFCYIGDGKIIDSDWKGITCKSLEYYLNNEYEVGLFRVTPELTEEQTKNFLDKFRSYLGIKYGYLQLIWQFILRVLGKSEDPDWGIDVDPGMICSEAMSRAFRWVGKVIKPKLHHSQIEPVDFEESMITIRIC